MWHFISAAILNSNDQAPAFNVSIAERALLRKQTSNESTINYTDEHPVADVKGITDFILTFKNRFVMNIFPSTLFE